MTARARAADVMNRGGGGHRGAHPGGEHQTLDAEVEQVRREARRRFAGFVLGVTNPGSHFRNRQRRPLDKRVFEQAGDLGLMRFSLPVEAGGDGRDKLAWGVVVEEIARLSRDPGFAVLLDITVEITELILSSGTPELIERYVPDLLAGRRFGVQGAYENRDPYDYTSTARLEGDTWVLNGAKRFLAGAAFADLFILFLRDEASNDMLAFVVEKDDPGVTPVPMDTMGLHTMGLGQVLLHDVRLPQWRLVWRADALSELNTYARIRRTMSACGVLGALEAVVENCVESLAARRRGGRPVLDYTNVERSVGEMRLLLQSARASVYRALDGTRSTDRDPYFDEFATVAKHQTAESALRVGQLVMGLQGGEAYMATFPWERFMRDILGLISGQGSQETLLIQLGQRSIVGLEGKRVREDAAERAVAKRADSWWALHAAAAYDGAGEFAGPVREVLSAAGLESVGPGPRAELAALLGRAHTLWGAILSGEAPDALPQGPTGLFDGRLAELAAEAWALPACAVARQTGLLGRLLQPCTAKEAAGDLPVGLAEGLLEVLVDAALVRRDGEGRYTVDEGLERVLIGGPRASAFAARLRQAVTGGARLRTGAAVVGRELLPGCGGEAPVLADALVNSLLGRLEGLPGMLDLPGARVGCAAGDGGRSAVELARHVPCVPVLALEPEQLPVPTVDGQVRIRIGDLAGFEADDRLALAWLPVGGLPGDDLRRAIAAGAAALMPGGWMVLPCPLAPKRLLGVVVARLGLAVAGGTAPADGEVEDLLRAAGLGHVRTAWEDPALGLRLMAARRP
ncbi:acyl-CoA dehydrogenase family protein [Streptomyces flavidovirens]|uniref:acyl-CoA dehydrogenase family protein n=1 Tax=Streptomyces flavidovirens TaxID=67298 RepID=UPI0004237BA0|nr:acyl-CoA dehydrogenase family protein [Streptomyces flavidovirens]